MFCARKSSPLLHLGVVSFRGKFIYHLFMVSMRPIHPIPFDRPATYQIRVQGRVDPDWDDRMAGMAISLVISQENPPVTTLEGELSDQAALAGVLNTLYELHLPILLVKCLEIGSINAEIVSTPSF
jgi:hypothetical protein